MTIPEQKFLYKMLLLVFVIHNHIYQSLWTYNYTDTNCTITQPSAARKARLLIYAQLHNHRLQGKLDCSSMLAAIINKQW